MEDTVPEDGSGLFGNETDDLEHTRQRHGECLVADFHQDGPKNGERQRKTDEEAGSAPRRRLSLIAIELDPSGSLWRVGFFLTRRASG